MRENTVKNWEEYEILPYLLSNKWAFHSFMDVDIRHETRVRDKDLFLIHSIISSQSINIFALDLQAPILMRWSKENMMTFVSIMGFITGKEPWLGGKRTYYNDAYLSFAP